MAADDVAAFKCEEAGSRELATGDGFSDPLPVGAGIEQQGDNGRGVADEAGAQRRSVFRAAKIESASTRTPVAVTRALARAMTSSTVACMALSTSIPRRYSCNDLPARAALAASSSRTASGTSRMVMAVMSHYLSCIAGRMHADSARPGDARRRVVRMKSSEVRAITVTTMTPSQWDQPNEFSHPKLSSATNCCIRGRHSTAKGASCERFEFRFTDWDGTATTI
jgi:hypothetical protein